RHAAFEQGCLVRDEKGDASAAPADVDETLRHDTLNPEPARTKSALDGPAFMRSPRLRDFLKEAGRNLRRNGLASLAALLIVTFSMMILGGALLALYRLRQMADVLPQHFEIAVFLREDLPRAEALNVQKRIEDLPGVARVQLVTKEQAWAWLIQKN